MSLLSETKLICKQYNIIPNRERGQNFLINEEVYRRIIEAADLSKADTALEVGAGLGILTRLLCQKSERVIAVEIDKKIFDYLKIVKKLEKLDNLELLNQNILDLKIPPAPLCERGVTNKTLPLTPSAGGGTMTTPSAGGGTRNIPLSQGGTKGGFRYSDAVSQRGLRRGDEQNPPPNPLRGRGNDDNPLRGRGDECNSEKRKFKIVANLPYNITSIFLRKFLPFLAEQKKDVSRQIDRGMFNLRINEIVLMLQKEVAERIASNPGKMSMLSVSARFYSDPQIIDYVDKNNFWPQPKVDSAIIKLKPISNPEDKKLRLEIDEKKFFQIARIGFSARRKKLVNNLANGLRKKQSEILPFLQDIGLNNNARAQELNVDQWIKLTHIINKSE